MASILDRLRTTLRKPENSTSDLASALTEARRAETEAVAAVERQAATVQGGFLDSDDKREKDRVELERLRLSASDAAAIRGELERRHAAAIDGEEQARRSAIYADAKRQADAAAIALSKSYPKLAAALVSTLKDLATAQQVVARANAALPDGAVPLADPEMVARGFAGLPREVISDEEVEAWGSIERSVPLDDAFQAEIYDCGDGWGKRGAYEGGKSSMGEPTRNYRRRIFRKVTYREAVPGVHPYPLACAIRLPTVLGNRMLWGADHPVQDPALSSAIMGEGEPVAVLARVAQIADEATAKPAKPERVVKVEYPSYREVVPLPAEQPMEQSASKPSGTGSQFGASPFAKPGARADGRR